MGQKVHPLGFRLGVIQKHQSQWFAGPRRYSQLLLEDYFLRATLSARFTDAGISKIQIERKLDRVRIEIEATRPAVIVGRKKEILERLKQDLTNLLQEYRKRETFATLNGKQTTDKQSDLSPSRKSIQLSIYVTQVANPSTEASFVAHTLVERLEKREPFRRVVRQAIRRFKFKRGRLQGIKIQISGRLNGAEIARTEWVREGRVPLQTLRADINYSFQTAKTIYGVLGIKVWVFKGLVSRPLRLKPGCAS